jgi:hypothetical protein
MPRSARTGTSSHKRPALRRREDHLLPGRARRGCDQRDSIRIPPHLSLSLFRCQALNLSCGQQKPGHPDQRQTKRRCQVEEAGPDLYRQMDAQDLVFAGGEASSAWGTAASGRERVAAYADQNSSQPRIHWLNRTARYHVEAHRCRIFVEQAWKYNNRTPERDVPLGKTIQKSCEC